MVTNDPSPGDPGNGYVSQDFSVESGRSYRLSLWSIVSDNIATTEGRFAIYDVTNAEWIVTKRGTGAFSASSWLESTHIFRVPDTCVTARLYLYQNIFTGESVWYDDIDIKKRETKLSIPLPQWSGVGGVASYTHSISASMGFDTMAMTSSGDLAYVSDWIEKGLGNHVEVKNMVGSIIWEGFVNNVSVNVGGLTVSIGPLMDVVNRARIVYKTVDYGVTPPQGGATVRGEWDDSDDSQERFGVLEGVITGGEGQPDEMSRLLGSVVAHTAWPETTQNFSLGAAIDMRVTVSCLGYSHFMNKYHYYETSVAGDENISTKLSSVLDTDPNNIFSQYNAEIDTNTSQVHKYESDDKTAMTVIKELLTLGDSAYNRYTFGVYEGRIARYRKVVDEPTYFQNLETGLTIDRSGVRTHPWEIRPAVWMLMTDFMPARPMNAANFKSDPRYIFIESVTYNAPYAFTVSGGRVSKFKQRIDRLGLGGI